MSAAPRVSVVLSIFNDEDRLVESAESILNQSFQDLELIAVDDGSTDGSGARLSELAERDSRIRVLRQENRGLTQALIRGCMESRGSIIARQDSDDRSHPNRLLEQVELLESDERIGFVSCTTQYLGPEGEPIAIIERPRDPAEATRGLLDHRLGPPAHGSVVFRESLYHRVGGYREEFYLAQDSDLWLRMAEHAWIAYVPSLRYFRRLGPSGISGVQWQLQREFGELGQLCRRARREGRSEEPYLEEARRLTKTASANHLRGNPAGRDSQARSAYFLGSLLVKNRDPRARRYLVRAIKSRPWHWKGWIRIVQSYLTARASGGRVISPDREKDT